MKNKVAILLALLILSISSKDLTLFVTFKINQSAIIQKFCVNKDAPELKCHGKCHLTKVLKENQKQKKEYPATNPKNNQITLFLNALSQICFVPKTNDERHFSFYKNNYSHFFIFNVFHPPKQFSPFC